MHLSYSTFVSGSISIDILTNNANVNPNYGLFMDGVRKFDKECPHRDLWRSESEPLMRVLKGSI
jgi:hypothetical protein